MATRYGVSLVVLSHRLSLPQLAAKLGREPGNGSHDMGAPRVRGTVWPYTVWREDAHDSDAPWHEQCLQPLREMPPECLAVLAAAPDDIAVSLDVAVFFETAYCGLRFGRDVIAELSRKGVDLEITSYPVAPNEEGDEADG